MSIDLATISMEDIVGYDMDVIRVKQLGGAQKAGMGKDIADAVPEVAELYGRANDIVGYDLEQTEQVVAAIGGRLLEISQELPEIEAVFRALVSEGKWLTESKSALQSKLRSMRQALGG